jgi:hypothetical protein
VNDGNIRKEMEHVVICISFPSVIVISCTCLTCLMLDVNIIWYQFIRNEYCKNGRSVYLKFNLSSNSFSSF